VLPHHSDPRALRALWSEWLATEELGLGELRVPGGPRANADANKQVWTSILNPGDVYFCAVIFATQDRERDAELHERRLRPADGRAVDGQPSASVPTIF
jgi:hypothetical protein